MYTLAGISNRVTGWGQAHETWSFLEALSHLGGETWFRLGDRDLATHVERTQRLRVGETLTEVTAALCRALGIAARVLPMSDDPVRTVVLTETGELSFQHYFVRDGCAPTVSGFRFAGIDAARPSPAFLQALEDHATAAILVCPSNPFVSVDPVLALDGVQEALRRAAAPVVAVSPIVGGGPPARAAIKGPAAKMMAELGMPVTAAGVARHYRERNLLDGFVIDEADVGQAAEIEDLGLPTPGDRHGDGNAGRSRTPRQGDDRLRTRDRFPARRQGGSRAAGTVRVTAGGLWAVLPVKAWSEAKRRLVARPERRRTGGTGPLDARRRA